ncbi:2OG-Fe(II) oxygenase family protein [Nocardia sp. NBC_01329]|uniref:2OG-Fe(II) oxygenase family protein n=1 Tax=Nocardia sp. NBC_01329 TaxID=2903594 RepID=UPI002E0DE475|nr:2OG-Fe(II) oxygenase [Nocardia sp. NBC_01329]
MTVTDLSTTPASETTSAGKILSPSPFHWHTYDLNRVLPPGWDTELLELAARRSTRHIFRPTMSSAREAADFETALESVTGDVLHEYAPWLYELYIGSFRRLAERYAGEPLETTSTHNRALSLNVSRGDGSRYPCHVDSNPAQGLLYLTDCDEQTGGALVIARSSAARDVDEVDADCTVLYPRRGHLCIFDAREHPHYVRPVLLPQNVRAVVTMNYYSASCPETVRPAGLDEQLFDSTSR